MGKVYDFSQEIADEICNTISSCGHGLRRLCKDNTHWPCRKTILRWLIKYPSFRDAYTRAKQAQIEAFIDEVIEIADDSSKDYFENIEGKMCLNHDHISRSRLRIDTRKWLASKLVPRLYGDRNVKNEDDNEDAISKVRID